MKTAVKPDLNLKVFCSGTSYTFLKEKQVGLVNTKSYQKLLAILISLSTFLIFPESPRELEDICESYNPEKLCKVL